MGLEPVKAEPVIGEVGYELDKLSHALDELYKSTYTLANNLGSVLHDSSEGEKGEVEVEVKLCPLAHQIRDRRYLVEQMIGILGDTLRRLEL